MNRDEQIMLIKALHHLTTTSTRTSLHCAYDQLFAYVLREAPLQSYSAIKQWEVPGLFVSYDELKTSPRPHVVINYVMGCGTILSTVLPKILSGNTIKADVIMLDKGKMFKGEYGVKIGIKHWVPVAHIDDYIMKRGKVKSPHYARQRH